MDVLRIMHSVTGTIDKGLHSGSLRSKFDDEKGEKNFGWKNQLIHRKTSK